MSIELRDWQKKAVDTIAEALKSPHSKVAINACVGSGKTFVPFEAIVQFINNHKNDKTFHVFVCPRIRLCKQQAKEAEDLFNARGVNVTVKIWNSDDTDPKSIGSKIVKDNEPFWDSKAKHILCIICDESLWGIQKKKDNHGKDKSYSRYDRFEAMLNNNITYNRINGIIAYDEAHNYTQKQKYMFGKELYKEA